LSREDIDEFEELERKFLQKAYYIARMGKGVACTWDVAKQLGMNELEMDYVVDHLRKKGFVEYVGGALFIRITPLGIKQVKKY